MSEVKGIYTLANDIVYDQLIALLNSVETNCSKDIPVCIIPYDDNVGRVTHEIGNRENVFLFSDKNSIKHWEDFAQKAWQLYSKDTKNIFGRHSIANHRKFCCFDGPFKKFVFMDADTILMQPLDFIFEKLNGYDFVVYDYQHKDPSHVYNTKSSKLINIFIKERIDHEIFCTGFFASKRNLLGEENIKLVLYKLKNSHKEVLYPKAPEQSLFNYLIMINNISVYNLGINLQQDKRTGNSVTSTHFEDKNNILYDKDNKLTYLHYIGIPASIIGKVCKGENTSFPYRDIFLHYRYLYEPEKQPRFKGTPKPYNQAPSLVKRIYRKLKLK